MDVNSALRRVKRQFGDEYNVVITDQDIYDWFYDAELDIIRSTSDNDITLQASANKFPLQVPDRVNLKRLTISGRPLVYLTVNELDSAQFLLTSEGTPSYWYFQGGRAGLWPASSSNDVYMVDVTYSKTPVPMAIVAPYLQWTSYPSAPGIVQSAMVPSDDDWKTKTSLDIIIDLSLDNLNLNMGIFGGNTGAAAALHFYVGYTTTPAHNQLAFIVSNGTTTSTGPLNFLSEIIQGVRFKFRINFEPATDTATLYLIDANTGAETVQSVRTHSVLFNKQITSDCPLYFGANDPSTGVFPAQSMKIFGVELKDSTGHSSFLFSGESDLGTLYGIDDVFKTSSGHTVTTVGDLIVPAINEFTIPEVYHEDVVKYALAKAHNKNQNFRAAEAEMEQYDQRVSTRRHEAQATDAPAYKIPDPDDYVDYRS